MFVCYFQCDFLSEGWTREVAQVSQRKQCRSWMRSSIGNAKHEGVGGG